MTETTYYKLKKPDENDNVYVSDLNGNADIIDKTLHDLSEKGTPIIDVGQQTSGRPFSITAEQMQALLSDPAPEVHVSMSGMVITLRRYDMTSNVAYYSNVMYSQGVKHFISMQAMGTSATITDAEEIQIPTPSGAGDKDKILQANANGGFDLKPPTVLPFLPLAGGTMTGQMGVLAPSKDNAPLRRIDGLSNATASSLGLAAGSVPDKAFAKLKTMVDAAQSAAGDKAKLVVGSYTGNERPTTSPTSRKIELGFTPKAVFVAASGSSFGTFGGYDEYSAGLAVEGVPAIAGNNSGNKDNLLEIVANGFNVYNRASSPYGIRMNDENYTYNYIAFA